MLGGHCYGRLSTFLNTGKVSLNVASHARLRRRLKQTVGDFNMAVGPRPRDLVKMRSKFVGRLPEGSSVPRTRGTIPWVAGSASKDQNGGAYR